ncbi:hypothetical protein [Parapedobacter luteus]|nr:hypothetical protein [Parapedobacter luteus]
MSLFWALYAFFFAVPFPMFLYYSICYSGGQRFVSSLSAPYWALVYLVVSVVLWSWLLARYFGQWFIAPAKELRQMNQLLRTGVIRDAEVVASRTAGKAGKNPQQLAVTLRFNNLSGVPIQETFPVVDMRPQLGRFDVGQRLRLRIDETLTKNPAIVIDGSAFQPDTIRRLLVFLGWMGLLGLVVAYYLLSYRYEHQGTGWRFLTFFHPLVVCPLTLLGLRWLMNGGLGRFFLNDKIAVQLKYTGHRATARLLEAKQTGTYINEQPQVRFELEYEDYRGTTHRTSCKKIVSLLGMDITRAETIPIFYLADQPQTVAFATDLDQTE